MVKATPPHSGRVGMATPPANAVGTPKSALISEKEPAGRQSTKPVCSRVDGAAGDGNPNRRYKTRFPTSMRLSSEMRAYALAAGFEPEKVARMFEMFASWNVAKRSYSTDWDQAWLNWVDREFDIVNDRYDRERAATRLTKG